MQKIKKSESNGGVAYINLSSLNSSVQTPNGNLLSPRLKTKLPAKAGALLQTVIGEEQTKLSIMYQTQLAVNRLKSKHTRDESDYSYNQQKHLDKLAFQTQKSQKRARGKSMQCVSGYPKDNEDIADVATSKVIKNADVSKKELILSNKIQEQQYSVEVDVVQKIRKGSTSGMKHRKKPNPQLQPNQLLLESHMIPIMPRKQKHFEPIKERTEVTQTDDNELQNFILNDIHIVNAQTQQLLIDLLNNQMENKSELTPFQNENIMTSYNRDSNQNIKVDAVQENYAERQRSRKETPENRNGIKRFRGKSVRKVTNDFQQQITSQECDLNSFPFELQNKASTQAERFSQMNQSSQPKIVSHSITTQNIQRSKDDGSLLNFQKQETFQSPTSLTKVIVAVTKDGYENQHLLPIAFNSSKLATVNEQHILDHYAQSLASYDFCQTSDRKPEIMVPKFSFETSDQRELFPLFLQKELSSNRNKKINDGWQRNRSKTSTNEQPNSNVIMSSIYKAENEFALIVRGINNLITNSPLNHDPQDFKKILQKTKQQVKQDQISLHHSEENEKDFGVVGIQKNVFKKKILEEQIAFRNQQKAQTKLKKIKALNLQAQDYSKEQGNTTMRDDSICMTPGEKKTNELIFMQAGQDNDSFLHNRNAVSALERVTKDTILESEATSQIISFTRNGPKMNSSDENVIENFDKAKELSSLIITQSQVSPNDSLRQKTQTQQTFRKNNFKVEIENKPATKLEASFSFQVQKNNGSNQDQQVAAPDYTAILQQQHIFEQKKWLKSSQMGQRTSLKNMWNGDRGISQMPNSFNTELIQHQSNYASYLGSKKISQDFSNFNHSRFKSQPTELGFAKSNFNAGKMMMVKTQEMCFEQKRFTAHGKRHLYMEKRKQSQLQKHHKGLFNMAEIHSTKLTGIKISRLNKPQELDPHHQRSISEMQLPSKPMKPANTSKFFQEIRAETKVQAEALIDFKCKGSMFNATQQKFVPLSNLVNLAVDSQEFYMRGQTSPTQRPLKSQEMQQKIIALRLDIEQQERVKSQNKTITQVQDPKERVFNILFPKEHQQLRESKASKKNKLDLNLQSDVQNLISQIGGNTDDPSRQNRMVFVTGQTNFSGHTEWIQGQIGTMVLEPDSAMIKIQIDDQDLQTKKSLIDSTNQLNKSSISQQRRQSIDRQIVSNQTNEMLSRESNPAKFRRPALTSSVKCSQAFKGTINASPQLNREQEITPNSSPHESSHDGEAFQSEYRTHDSQQKLKPISKISITTSNKKPIRQSQPIKIINKTLPKDVWTTTVSQDATLQISSIEELRLSRHRDVKNSQQKLTQHRSGFESNEVYLSQLKQKKRSTSNNDDSQLTNKKQQDQRYLDKKSATKLQQMDANSVTNQEKKNVGSKQKLVKSSAGWDKDRLQTQTEEILSSRHREAISTTQREEITIQDNKDIEEVTRVNSPTSKQIFGVMVVSHREKKDEPFDEEKTFIFNKMLNQIGLQQLKPKIFEAQLGGQYTEGKQTESLDSQEQVINFDTVLLDTKGNFRDKDKGLIKGLSYKKRQNDSQEKVSSKSKSKLNNIIIKDKKFRQRTLFCLQSLRRGDKVVKVQVKSSQLRQISNIIKVFKLQTEKDRLMYFPQIEDFCQMVESLQGYSYHQGVLDFVKDKTIQMPNRIPVNQFQDEYRLKQSQWFYHFEKSELENLCAILSIKYLNSISQNSDTHSNDDIDSITGETFSQNTLRRIHEDTSYKHYMVSFTSLRIINISCRSGLITDQSPLYLPFMYLPRLYFLSKHQLQLLITTSLVLSQSKQGIKLELDLLKLENELKKIKPCKERDAFKSFSLKVILFFQNFDQQIPFDEFVVEVEMPMFEIVQRVEMVTNDRNEDRLTGYVPEKNLQKYSRVLKHTLQVPDFALVMQKEQLVDWHQKVKDLIVNGTFGDQKTYMHQEYLMADYPESYYPTFQSLDNSHKTLLLPPAIKLQVSYIEPLQLELVAPIQNDFPEITSQLRERVFQKYHQIFTDVIVATMEVPMAKLESVYQVFGNSLSSTEDDKTTFAGCASNLIHVYADPAQALLKLDIYDWDMLEDIQLLNVTRILSNPNIPIPFNERSTLPKDQGISVLGPKPVILKPKDFQQDHSKCCNSKNQDCTLGLNNQHQTKTKPTIMLNDKLECSLRVKPAQIVTCLKIPMTDNLTVEHKAATSEGMMRFLNDLNHHRSLQRI